MTLIDAAETLDVDVVVRELSTLTPAQRAAQAPALAARRETMRADWYHRPLPERSAQAAADWAARSTPRRLRPGCCTRRTAGGGST